MLKIDESYGIHLTRGDTARISVTIINESDSEEYELNPQDTLRFTIRKSVKNEILLQKILQNSKTFHIKPQDTESMNFGKYIYDVELTTKDGDVYTIIEPATFELLTEVTF